LPEQLQQSDRLDPLVWKITSVAVIGSFLSQLDATVVNVSLSSTNSSSFRPAFRNQTSAPTRFPCSQQQMNSFIASGHRTSSY
jgi:hypothetical protein